MRMDRDNLSVRIFYSCREAKECLVDRPATTYNCIHYFRYYMGIRVLFRWDHKDALVHSEQDF